MTMNTRRTVTHRTVTYRTVAALAGAVALALGSVTAANAIDFPFPHPGTPEPEPPRIERANFKPATINPVQNTTVGVGQPIIITFNQPPKNPGRIERFVSVDVFNSKKEHYDIRGYFRWWSPTQLRWRTTSFWPQHTTVRVKVGDSVRTFHIGARHVAVADDKSHMITVYSDGKVIRHVPTSMGKPGHETPNGTYYIGDKHRHIIMDSSTYGVPVTAPEGYRTDVEYALRMTYSGIFLHAASWSMAAQGHYDSSHGCLNVSMDNGRWFFEHWLLGDVVRVVNSRGVLSKNDGMGDWAPGAYSAY